MDTSLRKPILLAVHLAQPSTHPSTAKGRVKPGSRAEAFAKFATTADSQAPLVGCPAPWEPALGGTDGSSGPVCVSGMARAAHRLVDLHTADGELVGLEWGTGTLSVVFLQGKLGGLTSIEHNATVAEIAARVKQV